MPACLGAHSPRHASTAIADLADLADLAVCHEPPAAWATTVGKRTHCPRMGHRAALSLQAPRLGWTERRTDSDSSGNNNGSAIYPTRDAEPPRLRRNLHISNTRRKRVHPVHAATHAPIPRACLRTLARTCIAVLSYRYHHQHYHLPLTSCPNPRSSPLLILPAKSTLLLLCSASRATPDLFVADISPGPPCDRPGPDAR